MLQMGGGGFVTGTSGDENRNRDQRDTKGCQLVEEAVS